jgi:hypothetical protein
MFTVTRQAGDIVSHPRHVCRAILPIGLKL